MKTLIKILFTLFTISIYAQKMPSIKVGEDKLGITSLDINIEIVGNVAVTTYDMLFYNPTRSILEGELTFPLGEGQQVSRLALDVNGKLREAVVVAKEQGRVVFEAIVRRGVDPVLLEKGTGNNYKARIYPIPAKGYKRVVLAYEQELILSDNAHYVNVPLDFKKNLDFFKLEMTVLGQQTTPSLTKGSIEDFQFKTVYNGYYAKVEKKNYTPKESLTINIPQDHDNIKTMTFEGYFYTYKTINENKRLRKKPNKISIFWDTSLSMKSRDLNKELEFLNNYIGYLGTVEIEIIKFSNIVHSSKYYSIINGEWAHLKDHLINTIYDGGTSFSNLFLETTSQENLLFSDGMKNLSDLIIDINQPVFAINSLIKANHSELINISELANGKYVNLKQISALEAFDKIKYQSFRFLGHEASNKSLDIYPKGSTLVSKDFSISGNDYCINDTITLKFGYGDEITLKETFIISPTVENKLVKRIWAQKKLNALQKDSELNKDAIIKHSMLYNLISNHTSLIVLETVWDYIKYKIRPPEELLEEYNRIVNSNKDKKFVSALEHEIEEDENEITGPSVFTGFGNISGNITDSSGLPLPGVNVVVKGATIGSQTDFDGNFSINAEKGSELTFSYIGFKTLETTIGDASIINISMEEDVASLDEVVITAFGTQTKQSLTGSVTVVRGEEIQQNNGSVANAIAGKVVGVQVASSSGSPGASPNIVIRGVGSLNGNSQPLYIIDGLPVSSNIDDLINTNDIESITVLKGAAETAIYGSRASNGVIIISTKSANPRRNYTSSNRSSTNEIENKSYNGLLRVKNNKINEIYIKELSRVKSLIEAYNMYLIQREAYKDLPTYYIDVYEYFKKWDDKKYGQMILSNVAEIDFDNYEHLRVLGYKLEESNNYDLASYIYMQVLKLRPEDSQSYRDLALAFEEIGLVQESFNLLNSIVNKEIYKNNRRRVFKGMQSIARKELNKLLQGNLDIEKSKFNHLNLEGATFDVRVVIDWNHNDTDIDLHVIDPNLEECYYSHSKTQMGGVLSKDMTQGFGPEEFTLVNAKKGAYYIKINYFGDNYQKLATPTFMKVTMFKNYGKPNESKEIKVIRLAKSKDKQIVAMIEV